MPAGLKDRDIQTDFTGKADLLQCSGNGVKMNLVQSRSQANKLCGPEAKWLQLKANHEYQMEKRRKEELEAEKVINENFDPNDLRDPRFDIKGKSSREFSCDMT